MSTTCLTKKQKEVDTLEKLCVKHFVDRLGIKSIAQCVANLISHRHVYETFCDYKGEKYVHSLLNDELEECFDVTLPNTSIPLSKQKEKASLFWAHTSYYYNNLEQELFYAIYCQFQGLHVNTSRYISSNSVISPENDMYKRLFYQCLASSNKAWVMAYTFFIQTNMCFFRQYNAGVYKCLKTLAWEQESSPLDEEWDEAPPPNEILMEWGTLVTEEQYADVGSY